MNMLKFKKTVVTGLIYMMFMALVPLSLPAAKTRHGATVEVTMVDGRLARGELLAVRNDSLLVYDRAADQGQNLDLKQIDQVNVVKKSKIGLGLAIGLGVGLVLGCDPETNVHNEFYWAKSMAGFGLLGGIVGAFSSTEKKFSMAGVSSPVIQFKLKWLRHYARDQD
jgi:hypothetical protein